MTKMKKEVVEVDSVEKKGFEIDWNSAMANDDDDGSGKEDKVPELEIVNSTKTQPFTPPSTTYPGDQMDCDKSLSENALNDQLERIKSHLVKLGPSLPDKGEKIRLKIAGLEQEKQRRALRRSKMDVEGSSKLMDSRSSGILQGNAAPKDTSIERNTGSKEVSRSTFAAVFSKPKMDSQPPKAFSKEFEDLGCASVKHKAVNKRPVTRQNSGWRMLSKVEVAKESEKQSKGNQISKVESSLKRKPTCSLVDDDESSRSWEESPSQSSRRRKKSDNTVINVDEEEPQPSTVAEEAVELPEGLQQDICYPSREDPHFVQVCLKDLECLAPREFLTSPVMNFYIRFLQQQVSSDNQISVDCHFFNTYFYKKLSDAVTYKGNDKDAFFVKFRRWWKGIDLFRKAYIFIPIHEDLHWSLVIVCIPDKEDDSNLTILHLDSLGLHSKRSIVENVKRFLKDEWKYLNQDDDYSLDLPISEKVWRSLPRRISDSDIQVPQQKNDFDCGPFVLFFIKRFIEEAPQRLKRKDLGMFDKKWFRPAEASALRIKIRNTLIDLFRNSNQTDSNSDQTDKTFIEPKTSDDNAAPKSKHCSLL